MTKTNQETKMTKGAIYQNEAWRKSTGMTLDPLGEPLEPVLKPRLELTSTDGNAFAVLGKAQKVGREFGWSKDKIECFLTEAKSGDYDNLLAICMKYFDII